MNIPFNETQAHDLALIWAKNEWEPKSKNFHDEADEGSRMEEFFNLYKGAYDYYINFCVPKDSET